MSTRCSIGGTKHSSGLYEATRKLGGVAIGTSQTFRWQPFPPSLVGEIDALVDVARSWGHANGAGLVQPRCAYNGCQQKACEKRRDSLLDFPAHGITGLDELAVVRCQAHLMPSCGIAASRPSQQFEYFRNSRHVRYDLAAYHSRSD